MHGTDNPITRGDSSSCTELQTVSPSMADDNSNQNSDGWDGPDDPANPKNWPESKKWTNIGMVSILALLTPLGSSMFAPGVPLIMAEFRNTSTYTATFVMSIYVLGFAFGPLLAAPLSEIYGRLPLYHCSNVLFVAFSFGTAFSNSMGMMLAFRFFMGFAGSVPITIGTGTIVDLTDLDKRGRAMALWSMGPLLGPCIGPVAGGYLVQAEGWRWVFRVIIIAAGILTCVCFFVLHETFPPVLLARKASHLRKATDNETLHRSKLATLHEAIIRPFQLLFTTLPVALMSIYVAIAYAILYLMISTFTFVYEEQYGFDEGNVGLTYIPAGIGMMIGVSTFGPLIDKIIQSYTVKGIEVVPEHRLLPSITIPAALALPAGMFIYGWATDKAVHWIVPMIGVVVFGIGLMGVMMCAQTYLLDSYPQYAASVTAATTVIRSIAGALLPLGALKMYDALGLGWGNSLLGFVALALVIVLPLFHAYGRRIRSRFPGPLSAAGPTQDTH